MEVEGWRGGSLSRVWKRPLNLDPTREVPRNLSVERVPFRIEDFVREPTPTPIPAPPETGPSGEIPTPGPGAVLVISALAGASLLVGRRKL